VNRKLIRVLPSLTIGLTFLLAHSAIAQQRYELAIPGGGAKSRAERTDRWLKIIDTKGVETAYQRAPGYDSDDGRFVGYHSAVVKQIIRWPVADAGAMQIATESAGRITFRPSQMEVRALAPPPPPVGVPPAAGLNADVDAQASYRLVPFIAGARGQAMTLDAAGMATMQPVADFESQYWHFTVLGQGVVRIHSDRQGRPWSLAGVPGDAPRMKATADTRDQLWQITALPRDPGWFVLTSLVPAHTPMALTLQPGGELALTRSTWSDAQVWRFVRVDVPLPPIFAQYRFVTREVRPNPPLAPAKIDLVNSHTRELWVLLVDRRGSNANGKNGKLKIRPGEKSQVTLERDPGGMLVEIYERVRANGQVEREEFETEIPPSNRYDLSVYELIVQSIAIDRTVKGGKIEDVQYSPKSIGWFELPAGPALMDGEIDVYSAASDQENPGQVRPINVEQWQPKPAAADPVESLLKKYEKK
jgi:hypothetical protein